jgi:2-C-methyl-D-erythritol 4-phosphate cytidylyltransferase/2-C-methyl-D-erythritol 2,4-cyclodiphosphate synthase
MKVSLILTCAGSGTRAGFNENKLLKTINGQTVISLALSPFLKSGLINQFIVTASKADFERIKSICPEGVEIVLGGLTRTESVKNALKQVDGDIVLIHDGARPFLTTDLIKRVIDCAEKYGSAIPVLPSCDTEVKVNEDCVYEYLGKSNICKVQTPQGFNANQLKKAYELSSATFNDDGEVYKNAYGQLHTVLGEEENVKLTYAKDFEKNHIETSARVGVGFDCHKLVENRKLILGGIEIPFDKGLLGHSDADVLTHAIMDAILSALSMRDIGYHFSDKDPAYKDANSMKLLEKVLVMIGEKGYKVQSVSAVIMTEKPKLLKHIPVITENLANALNLSIDKVGIGATTLEGLGFVGREEGICVNASAVLIKE